MSRTLLLGLGLFVAINGAAFWCVFAATRHLAPGSRRSAFGVIVRGSLTTRADFTEDGWRLWQCAKILNWVALVALAVGILAN